MINWNEFYNDNLGEVQRQSLSDVAANGAFRKLLTSARVQCVNGILNLDYTAENFKAEYAALQAERDILNSLLTFLEIKLEEITNPQEKGTKQ